MANMRKCQFMGCGASKFRFPDRHFFQFPIKRPEICRLWIRNCASEKLSKASDKKLDNFRVCDKHFERPCFSSDMRIKLLHDAVPTLPYNNTQDEAILHNDIVKLDDPVGLMDTIVKDLFETKAVKTRFLIRMVPVEIICKAHIDDGKVAFKPLLEKYFKGEPTTFSITFNDMRSSLIKNAVPTKPFNKTQDVAILQNVKCSPAATPIEDEDSEWTPPYSMNAAEESITNVRILLGDITYVASQILQDIHSDFNENHVSDAEQLVDNVNGLLKALHNGIDEIWLTANSVERSGAQSQINMLFSLVPNVKGLFTAVEHSFRDSNMLDTCQEELSSINDGLTTAENTLASMLEIVNENNYVEST